MSPKKTKIKTFNRLFKTNYMNKQLSSLLKNLNFDIELLKNIFLPDLQKV